MTRTQQQPETINDPVDPDATACGTCRFWCRWSEGDVRWYSTGQCRHDTPGVDRMNKWPETQAFEWCGQYIRLEAAL